MTDRSEARITFLASTDWATSSIEPLAGDASARRYARLTGSNVPAILMDAPPELDLKTQTFMDLATHLRSIGLSAPEVFAADLTHGFLILEDLGPDLVFNRDTSDQTKETKLYHQLCDIALQLWNNPPPFELPSYDTTTMSEQMDLFVDWYCEHAPGADQGAATELLAAVSEQLKIHLPAQTGLLHRDFHAQNLLFLPKRAGLASIGLLDFQDAMIGPQCYDIASLLTDARQDVDPDVRDDSLAHVANVTGRDADDLSLEFALCALQRNLRIIGVFARLSLHDKKPFYPTLLPRVFAYTREALSNPSLTHLTSLFETAAPHPTSDVIKALQTPSEAL